MHPLIELEMAMKDLTTNERAWAKSWMLAAFISMAFAAPAHAKQDATGVWAEDFGVANCKMTAAGRSAYFVLEPGYQQVLEKGPLRLQITVLDDTKVVDGVTTRVVEEREWDKGVLHEVSRNYYAMCEQTQDVLHFGEDVEVYDVNGKFLKNDGTWLAGSNGHRPGLVIPGAPKLGMKYYQEIAPGVSLNRGEIVSLSQTCKTSAGTFTKCMKIKGTSGMDAKKLEYKYYAPNVGLVEGDGLRLVSYGPAKAK